MAAWATATAGGVGNGDGGGDGDGVGVIGRGKKGSDDAADSLVLSRPAGQHDVPAVLGCDNGM